MKPVLTCGQVLSSRTSEALFLVLITGTSASMPQLDDVDLVPDSPRPCSMIAGNQQAADYQGGRRYTHPGSGLVLLCVWPGRGVLTHLGSQLVPAEQCTHTSVVA
jgi:hypothetical protein